MVILLRESRLVESEACIAFLYIKNTLWEVKRMVNENYSQKEAEQEEIVQNTEQEAEEFTSEEHNTEVGDSNIDESSNLEETKEPSEEQLEIKRLQDELEDKQNRLLRLQADLENYRRRVRLDQEAAAKYRAQSLIENILPALDNFERALNAEASEEGTKSLLKGMEMIYRQLLDALKKEGLEVIEAVGNEFDPNFHQAVMQVEDSNYGSNIVIEELQKGYKLKDRVIRPTMVKVNQ